MMERKKNWTEDRTEDIDEADGSSSPKDTTKTLSQGTHLNAHPDIFFGTTLDHSDDVAEDVILRGRWLAVHCCHTH